MIARGLIEQFPELLPGDEVAVDQASVVADPPAAPTGAPTEPTTIDEWRTKCAGLEAELRQARQPETPPDLKPLKRAAGLAGVDDETARRWCADSVVAAKRIGRRWYVDPATLRAHKQLKNAK